MKQQMDSGWIVAGIATLGFLAQLIGGLWRLANFKAEINEEFSKVRNERQAAVSRLTDERERRVREVEKATDERVRTVDDRLRELQEEHERRCRGIEEGFNTERRLYSDSLAALRQKINDVEREALEKFVRRESFLEIIARFTAESQSYRAEINARFDKFDVKLDQLIKDTNAR